MQNDIDDCIRIAKSYEEFLVLIREKGYSVSGEKIGDAHAKYIKFLAPGQARFVRGSSRNFGDGYTKEEMKDRIENPDKWQKIVQNNTIQNESTTNNPKPHIKVPKKDIIARTSANKSLIDTTGEKFQNSPGLQHWAKVKNLKTAAASYAAADNLSELQAKIAEKTAAANSARAELVELEHEMKVVAELLHYAEQYRDNKPFHEKYKKSKDPDRYLRMHESQLILYDGAKQMLLKIGINPTNINIDDIIDDYKSMTAQKSTLEKKYKSAEKESAALYLKYQNIKQYGANYHTELQKNKEFPIIQ